MRKKATFPYSVNKDIGQSMDKIYIGADHGGYKVKEKIKNWLNKNNIEYVDCGTDSEESADYPIFAQKVGNAVAKGLGKGILICKSGQGMSIAANKVKGIRACLAWNAGVAKKSREHNDANALCLPASYINSSEAQEIIRIWLSTPFSGERRHQKRILMIDKVQ